MRRKLAYSDFQPALIGGLFLSAGGSGVKSTLERHDVMGPMALELGDVELVSLDELADDEVIIVSTAVGAPGFASPKLTLRDSIDAANRLIKVSGCTPAGVICGHVPGFNAWLVAAALGIPYIDAAANGRGHPTVKMGGMGLASRPDISIVQVGMTGAKSDGSRLAVVAEGNIVLTSGVMRAAAVQGGGLVASARGPLSAGLVRANGAVGAISFQIDLGRAMLAADPTERVRATAAFLGGEVLAIGEVASNDVKYRDGFDVGQVIVRGDGQEVTLGVYNEFMTAARAGDRVATFPDLVGSLDPDTGDPVAISELKVGRRVAVVIAHRSRFPIGKGALDPAVFPEVEHAMNADLTSYL